jgi:Protein of unknown function (DUF3892)
VQYTVTNVRKESPSTGSHRHVEGVCTATGTHYTRREVVTSINAGNTWVTYAGGKRARIKPITYCPKPDCYASPYITTEPEHTEQNDLENLPEC